MTTLPPLILAQTKSHNILACRGSSVVMEIPDEAVTWLKTQSECQGKFSPQFLEMFKEKWDFDARDSLVDETIYFREKSALDYMNASYELNMACNYRCEHCYLGEKKNQKISAEKREDIFKLLLESGVIELQISGGEALLDKSFPDVYRQAQTKGFLVRVSTNGYALSSPKIMELFKELPPFRIAVSVYGASAATYEELTGTKGQGTFDRFILGLEASRQAKLPVRLNIVVTKHNLHELNDMEQLAKNFGFQYNIYKRLSPTIHGDGSVLQHQIPTEFLLKGQDFESCNAGKSFFHIDPLGRASMCMAYRGHQVDLGSEGLGGLKRLSEMAEKMLQRSGACTSCQVSKSCSTCPVMVKAYREVSAENALYCQHH